MSNAKQIEEMAQEIRAVKEYIGGAGFVTGECRVGESHSEKIARHLIEEKGYRKASDVAREIFEEIEEYMTPLEGWFLAMKRQNQDCSEEYWNGKLSAFKQLRGFLDVEIRKKYESEGGE